MSDLDKALEKLKGRIAQNAPAQPTQPRPAVQLPLWPEHVRGIPNAVLRSSLFGAIRRGRRRYLQRERIASVDGVEVLQTGPKLDQSDLDVWEQCLHLARTEGLGKRIAFSSRAFLRAIGRSTGGKNAEWLKGVLSRLAATVVEIKDGKRAYFGPMLHHGARDDESGRYVIELNEAIAKLYGSDGWTAVELKQRLALKGQPLAQWLLLFYSSHADPYAMKVETLHRLCGSEARRLRDFRSELRDALAALAAVTGWQCSIDDSDLVRVVKAGTASQQRHRLRRLRKHPR